MQQKQIDFFQKGMEALIQLLKKVLPKPSEHDTCWLPSQRWVGRGPE